MAQETPTEGTPLELCVHRYGTELLKTREVSDAVYQEAFSMLGEKGVVDLTALVGFYSAISLTLNAFGIPPVT